jgi:hypothetical protein
MNKSKRLMIAGLAALVSLGVVTGVMVNNSYQEPMRSIERLAGWVNYTPPEGMFSVDFPAPPQIAQKQLHVPSPKKTLNYSEYKSQQSEDVHYSVSYLHFPSKWRLVGSKTILNKALDAVVASEPEAKLLSKQLVTHQNRSAIAFHYMQGENEVHGKLIVSGTTLFKVAAVSPLAMTGTLPHDAFVDSFTVS